MNTYMDIAKSYLSELNIDETIIDCYINCNNQSNELEQKIYKIINIDYTNTKDNSYQTYRDLIVLMAASYELIIVSIVDRLCYMQHNKKINFDNRKEYAELTLNVHAPLAHRMGIYSIKTEIEELSLYYLDKEIYMSIVHDLEVKKAYRDKLISKMISQLQTQLVDIPGEVKIIGRSKSIYSIYKKMIEQNKSITDLYDLYALRIICEDVVNCYTILGIIHNEYPLIEGRFKDYIAVKKANLYQSLHTAVKGEEDKTFEIQIRTFEMDDIAENGVAAHWLYKEKNSKSSDIVEQLHLFKERSGDHAGFNEIFSNRIYTFTPNYKIIQLPKDASVIDFAYTIHTNVAEQMTGAKINGQIAKYSTTLKNGDIVEIMTKKGFVAPSTEWLDYVKSDRAKKKINTSLRKQRDDNNKENIDEGKEILKSLFAKIEKDTSLVDYEPELNKLMRNYSVKRSSELFLKVYNGEISEESLREFYSVKVKQVKLVNVDTSTNNESIHVFGAEGIKKQIAKCCSPIPGDEICGVIVTGVGIKIHRKECHNIVKQLNNLKIVDAEFNTNTTSEKFETQLKITSTDRDNLLSDLMNTITKTKISVSGVDSRKQDLNNISKFTLYVNNLEQLNDVTNSLNNVNGVAKVERVMK